MDDLNSIIFSYLGSRDIIQICSFCNFNSKNKMVIQMRCCNQNRKEQIERNYNVIIKTKKLISVECFLIDWNWLSKNKDAILLLEKTLKVKYFDWDFLSLDTDIMKLLEKEQDDITWFLSDNLNITQSRWANVPMTENANYLLTQKFPGINWRELSLKFDVVDSFEEAF